MPLDNSEYHISATERVGRWSDVNVSQRDDEIRGDIFTAWINHGEYPVASQFTYAIYPGVTDDSVKNINPTRFKVLSEHNTLAIYDTRDDVLQLVMNEAGQWSSPYSSLNMSLITEQAGMYIITGANSAQPTLHFADPTQSFVSATISFNNTVAGISGQLAAPDYNLSNVVSLK